MSVESDIQNAIASAQRQAEHEQRFADHMHECMLRQEAANRGTTPVWPAPTPIPWMPHVPPAAKAEAASTSYASGGFAATKFRVADRDGGTSLEYPNQWYVDWDALWSWAKKPLIAATVGLFGFGLYSGWTAFTARLTANNHYVYGHLSSLQINGHRRAVDLINANQLVDHSAAGRMRALLGIPNKFQFVRGVVIKGSVQNARLYGPGVIKITGDVSHSVVISYNSPVLIVGSALDGSTIFGCDVVVHGKKSQDSDIESGLGKNSVQELIALQKRFGRN